MASLFARAEALQAEIEQTKIDYIAIAIVMCESGGRHDDTWGDNGKAYGIVQYHEATFIEHAEKAGLHNADWKDKEHQLMLLKWAIENGEGEKWSCYQKVLQVAEEIGL